ncbi:MAG: 4Fe-4S dicluster domain-containing protein [Planctomycetes bacterium]|nr:4Fe-4S dicluster domain-containing protein [Planctomycetota bacterium]
MAGRIVVDSERCKGCGLCLNACAKGCLAFSKKSNRKGYFPAQVIRDHCTGCTCCALVCPEAAVSVYHRSNIQEIKPRYRETAALLRENV